MTRKVSKYSRCKKCKELVNDPVHCPNCANKNPLSATYRPSFEDGRKARPTLDTQEGNFQ